MARLARTLKSTPKYSAFIYSVIYWSILSAFFPKEMKCLIVIFSSFSLSFFRLETDSLDHVCKSNETTAQPYVI